MNHLSDQLLEEIVRRLVDSLQPGAIYLFGSHAYGTTSDHSDVDLLIVVNDGAGDVHDLAVRARAALRGLRFSKDVLVYHRRDMDKWASVRCSLPHTVVNKGKLLYAA